VFWRSGQGHASDPGSLSLGTKWAKFCSSWLLAIHLLTPILLIKDYHSGDLIEPTPGT